MLTKENGLELGPCPNKLVAILSFLDSLKVVLFHNRALIITSQREAFYRVYRAPDSQLMAADAVLCNHAVSLCEIFMPFDKPMVVIASTRLG